MKLSLACPVFVAATVFAGSASAQVITVTSQDRFMEGTTVSVTDGNKTTNGPFRESAPDGWFGLWNGVISVPGNMTVSGAQDSEFNGVDTITIAYFSMNFSGGGGPGTSGSGTLTNRCSYTFNVPAASTYTLNGLFGSGPFVVVTFTLEGPGTDLSFDTSSGNNVVFENATGDLAPGNYTLSLEGTGTVSFVGPGGNGSGAGGNLPLLTFVVTPGGDECPGDFNGDGVLNSQDFFDFLTAFFASAPEADFNGDKVVNSQDFFDYLTAFFDVC